MGVFFASWALWEEMTFALACAIVVVFLIGLFKLWRTSRQVRRQEVLDEEKRARLTEMRKAGMASLTTMAAAGRRQRTSGIPFGVRAIETGVEVDGIWISRPATPSRRSSKSQMGLPAASTGAGQAGERRPCSGPTLSAGRLSLPQHATVATAATAATALLDTHSNLSTPLPQISEDDATVITRTPAATASASRATMSAEPRGGLNEEALRRLEGAYRGAAPILTPQLSTYIPSSRMFSPSPSPCRHASQVPGAASRHALQQQQQQQQRISTASADSLASMGGGAARGLSSHSNRSTSSRSSTSSASRHPAAGDKLHHYHPTQTKVRDAVGPLSASPTRGCTPAPSAAGLAYVYTPASPAHVFPGEAIANRATRKVNPAFVVLPAGTFGAGGCHVPYTDEGDCETTIFDGRRRTQDSASSATGGARKKLRRGSLPVSQRTA